MLIWFLLARQGSSDVVPEEGNDRSGLKTSNHPPT